MPWIKSGELYNPENFRNAFDCTANTNYPHGDTQLAGHIETHFFQRSPIQIAHYPSCTKVKILEASIDYTRIEYPKFIGDQAVMQPRRIELANYYQWTDLGNFWLDTLARTFEKFMPREFKNTIALYGAGSIGLLAARDQGNQPTENSDIDAFAFVPSPELYNSLVNSIEHPFSTFLSDLSGSLDTHLSKFEIRPPLLTNDRIFDLFLADGNPQKSERVYILRYLHLH